MFIEYNENILCKVCDFEMPAYQVSTVAHLKRNMLTSLHYSSQKNFMMSKQLFDRGYLNSRI